VAFFEFLDIDTIEKSWSVELIKAIRGKDKEILKNAKFTLEEPEKKTPTSKKSSKAPQKRCGLCGKTTHLTKTECCDQWICDDEDQYVMFSYARNSCHRNHDRYTLCAFHHLEGHSGKWQTCKKCRESIETEIYVWYGTNEYNFEKLENPPAYEPTRCAKCNKVIRLGEGGYSQCGNEYFCMTCGGFSRLLEK